ncbi:MAG: hypothetical protein WBQ89_20255 [Candidatus Acidiferrum sp.]
MVFKYCHDLGFSFLENRGVVEKIRIRVVSVDFKDFGHKSASWSALDVNDNVDGLTDVGLNGANANVRPPITMATKPSPFAIGPVNDVCRTLTAFSQGEVPCAWEYVPAAVESVPPTASASRRTARFGVLPR